MPTPLVEDAQAIFQAAIRAVQPHRVLGEWLAENERFRQLVGERRVRVIGMGKAARSMAGGVEAHLGTKVIGGIVVVPEGYGAGSLPGPGPQQITVLEGGHPVPTLASSQAARQMRALAGACAEDELLLVLVSGGGTALTAEFAPGISLKEGRQVFQLLLEAGVDIHDANAVRKHITTFGGGRLAAAASPAPVHALVISDVVGNDLATIASGPTVPDPSTFSEAISVLQSAGLWDEVPQSVRDHLRSGKRGEHPESVKPGDPRMERVQSYIVATNEDALEGAEREARRRGYAVTTTQTPFTGEARAVGREHAQALAQVPPDGLYCMLWGGETTVTVRGDGRGGRNQEAALGAAQVLADTTRAAAFLSGGTDGIDGPTDAAGAWATPQTIRRAQDLGIDAETHLAANDSYPVFEALDGLVKTGPTHTNVMDIQIGLIAGSTET